MSLGNNIFGLRKKEKNFTREIRRKSGRNKTNSF